ncbi:MAG TPA: monovalent cation/H+ antiporter complex subunit F [Myxococcales bacterium LLY-WYZ-16_1]|nr:monovalent cation/H+ antiporter complex subunit F [Myxococcales bacterium LLY-WYZ-16_1]
MGIDAVWVAVLTVQALAILLAAIRVYRGPTLADRVISLDLIAFAASGMIGSYAIASGEAALLDAALILGLVVFLGTVSLARFLEVVAAARRRQ